MSNRVNVTDNISGNNIEIDLDNMTQTLNYSGSNVSSITVTQNGQVYTQTLTYSGSNVASVSNWVRTS